jgi:hypothetical protein
MKVSSAATAPSFPPTFRHVSVATPHRPGSDLDALPLPHLVVTVAGTDQGVGNFMQDGVPNLLQLVVPLHEVDGKLDGLPVINAKAHCLLAAVEPERPAVQTVGSHELQSQLAGVPGTQGWGAKLSCSLWFCLQLLRNCPGLLPSSLQPQLIPK